VEVVWLADDIEDAVGVGALGGVEEGEGARGGFEREAEKSRRGSEEHFGGCGCVGVGLWS
jgi:hypothetical protein